MKTKFMILLLASVMGASQANAAETYYARSKLSAVRPASETPTPTPVVGEWKVGTWSEWNSHCSDAATRTRMVSCVANAQPVADNLCQTTGPKPSASETTPDYSGCPAVWQTSEWSAWSSHCSDSSTRTRVVSCYRHITAVADNECLQTAVKPTASETVADFSGCPPEWEAGAWGAWNSTCSPSAVRTRTVTCVRGATQVADSECTSAKLATEETGVSSSGCEGILQNQALTDPLTYWTISGGWQWRSGDVQLNIGSSITQTGFVPTKVGVPYTLSINYEPLGGTAYRVYYTYTIKMGTEVIQASTSKKLDVTFVGNGQPVTVTIKVDSSRDMRLFDLFVR